MCHDKSDPPLKPQHPKDLQLDGFKMSLIHSENPVDPAHSCTSVVSELWVDAALCSTLDRRSSAEKYGVSEYSHMQWAVVSTFCARR